MSIDALPAPSQPAGPRGLDRERRNPIQARRRAARSVLLQLLRGNERFAQGNPRGTSMSPARRAELAKAQKPCAVIFGCVDSRVPPEVIFDQRLGDLLTIRTAGQALSGGAAGSIEFGTNVLAIPLVLALGHSECGAVQAALDGGQQRGRLGELVSEVAGRLGDPLPTDSTIAVAVNLAATVRSLRELDTLQYQGHPAHVVGALYDVRSGRVTIADDGGLVDD